VSGRLCSILAGLAVLTLFSGCASQPRTGGLELQEQEETLTGPSTVIAGARVDEVRSVALGLARSKGWEIVNATDQKVVLRRPVSPDAPQAVELGLAQGATPNVEVTTLFRQVSGGVNVTVNAQLVARVQGQGEAAEKRIDYSDSYRDNLLQSLASLRSAWAANHQRVARALPPIGSAGQAAAETAAELNSDTTVAGGAGAPLQSPIAATSTPTAWGTPDDEGLAPLTPRDEPTVSAPVAPAPKPPAPVTPAARPPAKPQAAPAKPQVAVATKPQTSAPAKGQTATPAKPQTAAQTKAQPAPPGAKPKPTSVTPTAPKTAGTVPAPVRTTSTSTRPPAASAPASSADNMLALRSSGGEVANAERYAARRGCQVRPGRSMVFRRDGASEYVRVFCTGDPAFVVKCTNGACKVLE